MLFFTRFTPSPPGATSAHPVLVVRQSAAGGAGALDEWRISRTFVGRDTDGLCARARNFLLFALCLAGMDSGHLALGMRAAAVQVRGLSVTVATWDRRVEAEARCKKGGDLGGRREARICGRGGVGPAASSSFGTGTGGQSPLKRTTSTASL
eukprot:scaffold1254_cov251-Pinguiococcus_pyrenoidosus.AAC.22